MLKKEDIVVFDFDGTIFSRDSLADFLMQTCGKRRFFLYLPLVIGLKLATISGMLSTHCAKEKVITLFLHGMKWQDFLRACSRYANRIPRFIYPAALEQIKQHLIVGDRVAIISANASITTPLLFSITTNSSFPKTPFRSAYPCKIDRSVSVSNRYTEKSAQSIAFAFCIYSTAIESLPMAKKPNAQSMLPEST